MKTTWMESGRKHIATNGEFQIGRVIELTCKTERPFMAISENGMIRYFNILFHAKDWVEECFDDIAAEFHAANA